MKILVADDHPLVCDAYARVARTLDAGSPVETIEACSFAEAEHACNAHSLDLALVDLNMPDMEAMEGLGHLLQAYPSLPIIVSSAQDDPGTIRAVFKMGARGFCSKKETQEGILRVLLVVLNGGVGVPKNVWGLVDTSSRHPDPIKLTDRQLEVLRALMRTGGSNKHLARMLGIGEGTVRSHVSVVLAALNATTRTEAVLRAREMGIRCQGVSS